ncbi:MAG: sugar transferase [Chloroflexi bacterium]|nr:sugar transferase [Chloroflexota bacterium]
MVSKPKNGTEVGSSAVIRDGYKRRFDLAIIVVAHVLLLPVFVVLWIGIPIAIWLGDRGRVFYLQERVGRSGKRFEVIKFRTMVTDAESETGPVWAAEGDSRTTRVGRVLRMLHLDELPQVVNILRGEMSIVGPRPERPELVERFSGDVPAFSDRLRVRPGVAGLAQVRGSGQTRPRDKLRYDNLYIETLSPWMDVKLLLLSVWVVLRRWLR